jgi:hypothetical protein
MKVIALGRCTAFDRSMTFAFALLRDTAALRDTAQPLCATQRHFNQSIVN